MSRKQDVLRTFLALTASILAFILFLLVLEFNDWISLILAVAIYFGVFFFLKPIPMIGSVEMESLHDGEELKRLLEEGKQTLAGIRRQIPGISDMPIRSETLTMADTAEKLIAYLEQNPDKITKSRRFLSNHLKTAESTLSDYLSVGQANLAQDKLSTFRDQTRNIMHLLTGAFTDQFTQLIEDKLLNIDVQNELLESKIQAERKVEL
jgi:5-bromo-4-chloroindolyl phosphate hydrolysis protein